MLQKAARASLELTMLRAKAEAEGMGHCLHLPGCSVLTSTPTSSQISMRFAGPHLPGPRQLRRVPTRQ